MASPRMRSLPGAVGRFLLGFVVAILVAGVVLVLLAYYADLEFDVEAVVLAIVGAGILVFAWTRWR